MGASVSGNSEIKIDLSPDIGRTLPCVPFVIQGRKAGEGSGTETAKTCSAGTQQDRAEQKQSAPSPVSPAPQPECTGCGYSLAAAIAAVCAGKAARCPECSVLSLDERNALRTAFADGKNPRSETGMAGAGLLS